MFFLIFKIFGSGILPCTIFADVMVGTTVIPGTGTHIVLRETIVMKGLSRTKGLLFLI